MKLLRYGPVGQEKPGVIDAQGQIRDLSGHIDDIGGQRLSPENLARLRAIDIDTLPRVAETPRLGACVSAIGKIICIGLNYRDHAEETGQPVPEEPVIFAKFTSAVSGPNDPIPMPRGAQTMDWEAELAVVIGKTAKYVSEAEALDHVAGYCVANDLTDRAFQIERGGQWTKGKSCDGFAPLGPWLVTPDEVDDPQALDIWLEVDGVRYQQGNTGNMIFNVAWLISYLSQFFSLHPGDVILTGTPAGVGMAQKPQPVFLRAGQRVCVGIEGLGEQRQLTAADG
ncbi:fumarylacetoacetate hydrolase family protein [Marinobacterium rhizophilum]|uniref:fumarylacetoacetate hydrolase family protein n=1 Tax=Marinobacterium rhizophilum TaxID=420402 RepID=UPI00037F8B6F|nr:fumarylacetoacetate hydrolase family protein [Marinobacterium rhizophilum]